MLNPGTSPSKILSLSCIRRSELLLLNKNSSKNQGDTKMAFRKKLGNRQSKRYFSKTAGAKHVHPKNANIMPVRGGIRA